MNQNERYERIPFEDPTLPIRVNFSCHLPQDIVLNRHFFSWHEQIELLYFHQGTANVYCGDQVYTARQGDVVLINPFEIHCLTHVSGDPMYDCLMIDAALYQDARQGTCETLYFDFFCDGRIRFENLISQHSKVSEHVRALCDTLREKPFAFEIFVKAHVFSIFAHLFHDHISSGTTMIQSAQNIERFERIKPALEHMQNHLHEHISLEDLADACNISQAHFCRLFRQITSTTPIQYLTEMRLHKAAVLLKSSDKSVTQIAECVGFDDIGYFSRRFKNKFGLTPIHMKKHNNND